MIVVNGGLENFIEVLGSFSVALAVPALLLRIRLLRHLPCLAIASYVLLLFVSVIIGLDLYYWIGPGTRSVLFFELRRLVVRLTIPCYAWAFLLVFFRAPKGAEPPPRKATLR